MENNHICQVLYVVFTNSSCNRFISNTIESSCILTKGTELIILKDNIA